MVRLQKKVLQTQKDLMELDLNTITHLGALFLCWMQDFKEQLANYLVGNLGHGQACILESHRNMQEAYLMF